MRVELVYLHSSAGMAASQRAAKLNGSRRTSISSLRWPSWRGARLPASQVEGRSLLPLLEEPATDWVDRYLFTHRGRWKTGDGPRTHTSGKNFAVRNQRYRFVNNTALFDMRRDPGQKTNIFDQHPEVVSEMRNVYDAWWKETRPLMVNEAAPLSRVRPFHELYKMQASSEGIPQWTPPEL